MKALWAGLAVMAALGGLSGCAPFHSSVGAVKAVLQAKILNPLNDDTVAALGFTFAAVNGLVITYGAFPLCPAGQHLAFGEVGHDGKLCHDAALYATLAADTKLVAEPAWEDLVELQKTHPKGSVLLGGALHDKFTAAQHAIAVVTDLTNAYVAISKK